MISDLLLVKDSCPLEAALVKCVELIIGFKWPKHFPVGAGALLY